ncbi:MAG TPA: hypothetical protein VGR28_07925 [Candidatus Thermoplasmatota archaeon]|jgi:uncharacterized membrane protein YgdD (TMEM256/DUF423 family)|nr:hypothetical protein [Candidatus Thermoplasmatota archaeon]
MAPGRWKGVVALVACVHCSLTFFVAVGALFFAGATAPTLLGVRADVLLVPLAGVALFTGWLWWGRRAAERCEVPTSGAPPP